MVGDATVGERDDRLVVQDEQIVAQRAAQALSHGRRCRPAGEQMARARVGGSEAAVAVVRRRAGYPSAAAAWRVRSSRSPSGTSSTGPACDPLRSEPARTLHAQERSARARTAGARGRRRPAAGQQHEVHHDRRAAVGDERQRHAGQRDHARDAADDHEHLHGDDERQAGRQQLGEGVARQLAVFSPRATNSR